MPADFVLVSRYITKPGFAASLSAALGEVPNRVTLLALSGDEIVTLDPYAGNSSLNMLDSELMPVADRFAEFLAGDVRRELLRFVEAPKICATDLPDTPYVQLRHVEVKPDQMAAYRKWREATIFDVVRGASEVETFLAYHSVISGQPGVMFISGFSTSPDAYGAVFASDRYKMIVQQAGDQFITGGTDGLYTKIYRAEVKRAA